mmetsp:Transcript_30283/g.64152  ORF Transcript_30283/g.64152 Transcript_30283/m.64152 type:complete len:269 (+) Transcript_30283:57-863(+)
MLVMDSEAVMIMKTDGRDESHDAADTTSASVSQMHVDEMAKRAIDRNYICQLAHNVCEAMERGDTSELDSILNISMEGNASPATSGTDDNSAASNQKCHELLTVFYSLIGHDKCDIGELEIPLSVKAHLLLRALLRIRFEKYSIPWEAANAAIQSLQYSNNNHHSTINQSQNAILSQGEELAMIAEIRSFVIYLRTEKMELSMLSQLTELGNTILTPLRMTTISRVSKERSMRIFACKQSGNSKETSQFLCITFGIDFYNFCYIGLLG